MKRFLTMAAAAVLVASSASALTIKPHRTIERKAAPTLNVLENQNVKTMRIGKHEIVLNPNAEKMEAKLVSTGVNVNDAKASEKVMNQISQRRAQSRAGSVIVEEHFSKFTQGSQSQPYGPVNNTGGQIPASMTEGQADNLRAFGVYSCGGWAMLRASNDSPNNYPEFIILNIDLTQDISDIEFGVAALCQGSKLGFILAAKDENGKMVAITNPQEYDIPYDGEFYTLQTSKNGSDKLPKNAWLLFYEVNNQDIACSGIYVEGGLGSGSGTGGGTTPDDPVNDTQVGNVKNVTTTVGRTKQNFTTSWTAANNAMTHEVKVYNDVYAESVIPSIKLLDMDYSSVNGGSSDPYSPNTAYWKNPTMYLDAMPGGCVHNLVILNGAIGFTSIPSYMETQGAVPGFETDVYDLSPTNGVATLKFDYYATAGTGILLYEVAWNESTNKWEIVDEGEFDESNGGLMIETDEDSDWDYLEITLDKLPRQYSGEVYFLVGVYSILGETDPDVEDPANAPVFFYIKTLSLTMKNIPAGSHFYYTYKDNPAVTGTSYVVNGDISNNYFNYTIRGVNTDSKGAVAFGPWYELPYDGTPYYNGMVWVRPGPETDAIEMIETDGTPNAPAEYYNMMGVRVDNPTPGMYIIRRGNTVEKVMVK